MALENVLMIANIIIGLIAAYENVRFYQLTHAKNNWHWIKLLYAAIGLYWSALYAYKLFLGLPAGYETMWHSIFVRPAVTVTLSAIAASAIMRMKVHKE